MPDKRADIIAQLQREILPLQGLRTRTDVMVDIGWGPIDDAFPNRSFPLGAVHEFESESSEDMAATTGFLSGILSALMRKDGVSIWISSSRTLFPPALKNFGIEPDRIIFLDLQKEKDIAWAMEEALKCGAVSAVIGEMNEISFTVSRRLQLAVEQSQVTGFLLRSNSRKIITTAAVSRWRIKHLPSETEDGLPGIGFPRWNVELLKVRNGRPGSWQLEWAEGRFRHISTLSEIIHEPKRKAG